MDVVATCAGKRIENTIQTTGNEKEISRPSENGITYPSEGYIPSSSLGGEAKSSEACACWLDRTEELGEVWAFSTLGQQSPCSHRSRSRGRRRRKRLGELATRLL